MAARLYYLSYSEIARAAKVNRSTVYRALNGKAATTWAVCKRLGDVLHIDATIIASRDKCKIHAAIREAECQI